MASRWLYGGLFMASFLTSIFIAMSMLQVNADAPAEIADHVVVLDESNYKSLIESKTVSLVKFYSPSCGHCKAMAPDYKQAAFELKDEDVLIAKVDCTQHQDICQKYQISGYPTLKTFWGTIEKEDGGVQEYPPVSQSPRNWRSAPVIVDYIRKLLAPAITIIEDGREAASKVEEAVADSKVVVVGINGQSGFDEELFEKIAESHRSNPSIAFFSTDFLPDKSGSGNVTAAMAIYKDFDETFVTLETLSNLEEVQSFVDAESTPILEELDQNNFPRLAMAEKPLAQLYVETEADLESARPEYYKLAKKYRKEISFVWVNATKYGSFGDNSGLPSEYPAFGLIVFLPLGDFTKYPLRDKATFDVKDVVAHVEAFQAGKLSPYFKSEEEPSSNDGPVKIVTMKSLQKVAFEDGNDVLIEFYAPWCGHCKALAPVLDQLGTLYKGTKIVIAKFDATANDVPPLTIDGKADSRPFQIAGFPTLYFIKGDTKEVLTYESGRRLEDFKAFISKNASHKEDAEKANTEGATSEDDSTEAEDEHDEL